MVNPDEGTDNNVLQLLRPFANRIISQILPGDGTIHLDYINRVIFRFGVDFTIPDQEALKQLALSIGVAAEEFDLLWETLASLTPTQVTELVGNVYTSLVAHIPANLL